MTSATKVLVTELKRNARVLKELSDTSKFRIAYKTGTGWKRLRVSTVVADGLRQGAVKMVENRMEVLLTDAVTAVTDGALAELVDEFNNC